ncbi:MAG: LicD family protein [archaeon]|nr:LicD family protein [archaeon]
MVECSLEEFKVHYLKYFGILLDFLKKHDIVFGLDHGTMLGAYREGGMIKWDCDIDIVMPLEMSDKLESLQNELPDCFYYKTFKSNSLFFGVTRVYIKNMFIQKSKETPYVAYFDIFPYVSTEEKYLEGFTHKLVKLHDKMNKKTDNVKNNSVRNILKNIYHKFLPGYPRINKSLMRSFNKIKNKGDCLLVMHHPYIQKMKYPTSFVNLKFNGYDCPVFENPEHYLLTWYGPDYMTPKDFGIVSYRRFYLDESLIEK